MPARHSVQNFVVNPLNTQQLLIFHSTVCSVGHIHGCSTLFDNFLSTSKKPFIFGAHDYESTPAQYDVPCEHKYIDHTQMSYEYNNCNNIKAYSENDVLFLKDCLVFIEADRYV